VLVADGFLVGELLVVVPVGLQSWLLRADVVGWGKMGGWGVDSVVLVGVLVVRSSVSGGGD
jgi:hypothetical protein